MENDQVNLNKYISSSGFCSRREADKLIEQARVTVNDELALAGTKVTPGDVVEVDGEPIKTKKKAIYIACNKPVGVTSTTDVKDKTNIITFLNHPKRIFPVGRLDKDSDGLILLTNDGDIVNKILRASNNHEKEYIVIVDKAITPDFIQQMSTGVPILGTRTKKCEVRQEGGKRFRITLTQGLNRQIRRMCEFLGYKVVKLTRIRIMNVQLEGLAVGHWRYLSEPEMNKLNDMMKGSVKTDTSGKTKNRPAIEYTTPPLNEREARDRERKEAFLDGIPKKTGIVAENGKTLTSREAKIKRLKEEYLKAKKNDPNRKQKIAEKKDAEEYIPEFDERRPAIKKGSSSRFKGSSHKADRRDHPERSGKPSPAKNKVTKSERPERGGKSASAKSKPGKKERPERGGKPAPVKSKPAKKERPERGGKPAPAKNKTANKRAPKR